MAALEALRQIDIAGLAVDVVIGAGHRNRARIEALCASTGFSVHVQTARIAELMAAADLSLGAGGSATWERCCVGLPSLVVAVADNQYQLVNDAASTGLLYAPRFESNATEVFASHVKALAGNPLLLRSMSTRGMQAVDGRGAARVVRAMGFTSVTVRRATTADSRNLFEWRNDPVIRAVSRSPAAIDWVTHSDWFDSVIRNPQRLLLVGERAGRPVGVVRFDLSGDAAEVSIYKVPGTAEPGVGFDLLLAAERWLGRERPDVHELIAEVLDNNRASHELFASSGYRRASTRYAKGIRS
jgi:RimJ/RimL family protein N-acetyltransferase